MSTVVAALVVALTAVAVVRGTGGDGSADAGPAPADPRPYEQWLTTRLDVDPDLALKGRFRTVPGKEPGTGRGEVVRYRVQVEQGVDIDGAHLARAVHETLNDPRGWGGDGSLTFERVDAATARFTITVASTGTVNTWCARDGLDTGAQRVSCNVASTDRVMINAWRWAQGSATYGDDIAGYRQMLVQHEVGHRLGHGHRTCGSDGAPAPVMMQQTLTLITGTRTCAANPWPRPTAAPPGGR